MKKIILAISIFSVLLSCNKDDEPTIEPEKEVDFYACGGDYPNNGINKAVLWKNGEPTYLTDGTYIAYAYSIFVEQGNTHVVGYENSIGKYWKNGVAQNALTPTAKYFTKVQVINNKVYILGKAGNDIILWEDGVATTILNATSNDVFPCDFKVVGNDKYVLIHNDYKAILWKNGTTTTLSDSVIKDQAKGLCISDNNVYVLAEEYTSEFVKKIKYWKNGVVNYVNNPSSNIYAYNIDVKNNDVYISGTINQKAYFWKNGVATQVGSTTGYSFCYGIQVVDNNVYTINTDNGKARFMKNTTQAFIDNITTNGDPYECFVVYK